MDVSSSEFIVSSPNVKNCPNEFIPEYALLGDQMLENLL